VLFSVIFPISCFTIAAGTVVLLAFHQVLAPVAGSALLSTLLALAPVVLLLLLLAGLRLTAWLAALIGSGVTFLLAVFVWQAPVADAGKGYFK
jgi:lactate permease